MRRFVLDNGFLVAMLAAVALAIAWPAPGAAHSPLHLDAVTQLGIALVFLLHGANLSPQALRAGAANWRLHLFVQASTFVLFPVLGALVFVGAAPILPDDTRFGLFFLCAVCSTISSSVAMVAVARGDVAAAIFDASLSGLIGIFLTPLIVGLLHSGFAAGAGSPLQAIGEIALKLLAPFVLGQLVRPWLAPVIARHKLWVSRLDRGVIVLIVYTAFCHSTAEGLWSRFGLLDLLQVTLGAAVLLAAALAITTWASRRLGFRTEEEIVAVFCGSKKSLASGAPIAKVIFGASPSLGAILLPLMIYHQLQLVVCSILAKRYAHRIALAAPASLISPTPEGAVR